MKKVLLTACAFCFALTVSVSLFAADEKPEKKRDLDAAFKKMDADKDGKLSLEEFVGKRTDEKAEMAKKAFTRKDKNKDGSLSLEEFKAMPKPKSDK